MTVDAVRVFDSKAGEPVRLQAVRTTHKEVQGEWSVQVRRLSSAGAHGQHTIVCSASLATRYYPEAALPDSHTLDWWTAGECIPLPEGEYVMTISWVLSPEWFPSKVITVESNIFQVTK